VIEVARAASKAAVQAGFERWQARHPEAADHLEPADVLIDGMRGRSSLWYRLRVNLVHVPDELRPPQEPLDPDYDPWASITPAERAAWEAAETARRQSRHPRRAE
jgi:bifunctional non-homologous end joining protein LigD